MTENKTRALLDSNVLIYSVDITENEKHVQAKEFIKANLNGDYFFVSAQNLAEFFYNVTERFESPVSFEKARAALEIFSTSFTTFSYSPENIVTAGEFQERFHIHFWDALLAATMLENKIFTIFTENVRDFSKIPGIKAINPFKKKKKR